MTSQSAGGRDAAGAPAAGGALMGAETRPAPELRRYLAAIAAVANHGGDSDDLREVLAAGRIIREDAAHGLAALEART